MFTKDNHIRGEALLEALSPELRKILQKAPKTGTLEIKVMMKGHRIIGTAFKTSTQEQAAEDNTGKEPEGPETEHRPPAQPL
jgi:hypothetical protein